MIKERITSMTSKILISFHSVSNEHSLRVLHQHRKNNCVGKASWCWLWIQNKNSFNMKHSRYFQSTFSFTFFHGGNTPRLESWLELRSRYQQLVCACAPVAVSGLDPITATPPKVTPSLWVEMHVLPEAGALTIKNWRRVFLHSKISLQWSHCPACFSSCQISGSSWNRPTLGYTLPSAGRTFVLKWYILSREVLIYQAQIIS